MPIKEKGSTPEPLDTTSATAESGEAKKLSEEKEATGGGGGGEGEQATVAQQGDQEHGHRDSSEEPGVYMYMCVYVRERECVYMCVVFLLAS